MSGGVVDVLVLGLATYARRARRCAGLVVHWVATRRLRQAVGPESVRGGQVFMSAPPQVATRGRSNDGPL